MVDKRALYEILKSREDRAAMQKKIIDKYKHSLISFTLNIPGPNKDNLKYRKIHDVGMNAITDLIKDKGYKIEFINVIYKNTGAEGYISIDIDPHELKMITMKIEDNHELGRLFDIDVFNSSYNQISRKDLNYLPRKCLLCGEDARVCSKTRAHSLEELIKKINQMYDSFFGK